MKERVLQRLQRTPRNHEEIEKVREAYQVISRNLNVMGGGDDALLRALSEEHSTLLGQLLNVVLDSIALREGDGRFSPEIHRIAAGTRNWFV